MFFTEKVITKTIVTYPIRDCPWCGGNPDVIVEDYDIDKGDINISLHCINAGCKVYARAQSISFSKNELKTHVRRYLEGCIKNWNHNLKHEIHTSALEVCYEELMDDIRENRY